MSLAEEPQPDLSPLTIPTKRIYYGNGPVYLSDEDFGNNVDLLANGRFADVLSTRIGGVSRRNLLDNKTIQCYQSSPDQANNGAYILTTEQTPQELKIGMYTEDGSFYKGSSYEWLDGLVDLLLFKDGEDRVVGLGGTRQLMLIDGSIRAELHLNMFDQPMDSLELVAAVPEKVSANGTTIIQAFLIDRANQKIYQYNLPPVIVEIKSANN